jgi:hypothetical protein
MTRLPSGAQMRLMAAYTVGLLICAAGLTLQTRKAVDPLSGIWIGDWGPTPTLRNPVTVELKWDGRRLTGTVNPGPNAIRLQKTSFDTKTNVVHLEADVVFLGQMVHDVIQGRVENGMLIGSWHHDDKKGDFKIIRKSRI